MRVFIYFGYNDFLRERRYNRSSSYYHKNQGEVYYGNRTWLYSWLRVPKICSSTWYPQPWCNTAARFIPMILPQTSWKLSSNVKGILNGGENRIVDGKPKLVDPEPRLYDLGSMISVGVSGRLRCEVWLPDQDTLKKICFWNLLYMSRGRTGTWKELYRSGETDPQTGGR